MLFNECQTISTVSNEKFSKIKAIDCLINVIELFNNNDSSQLESLIFDNMNYKVIDLSLIHI